MDKSGSGYRIAPARAGSYAWLWLVGIAAAGYGLYQLGGAVRVANHGQLQASFAVVNQELVAVSATAAELQSELATLQQRHELDALEHENKAGELTRLRHQLTDVRRELELYSSLADQTTSAAGIAVHRFEIEVTALPTEYRYDLVLTQGLASTQKVAGVLQVMVFGPPNSQPVNRVVAEHSFEFQLFEKFTGTLIGLSAADVDTTKLILRIAIDDQAETTYEFQTRDLLTAVAE